MKQLLITFFSLIVVFIFAWNVKANTPINRPSNLDEGHVAAWYESSNLAPIADDKWTLDPRIPDNYIPVPGTENLYMIIDESGNIISYRECVETADGTLEWKDVNPDIPEGYEPFEGIKDMYKVTNPDGSVSYVKYIRNDDDTYCFMAVDENGVPLDIGTSAEQVGKNYVHETGNIYSVYNDSGVKMGYRERVEQPDGTHTWKLAMAPTSSDSGFGTSQFASPTLSDSGASADISSDFGNFGVNVNPNAVNQDAANAIFEEANTMPDTLSQPQQPQQQPDEQLEYVSDGVSEAYAHIVHGGGPELQETDRTMQGDGTYTTVENIEETRNENGVERKYITKITKTFDMEGNLLSSSQEGPFLAE